MNTVLAFILAIFSNNALISPSKPAILYFIEPGPQYEAIWGKQIVVKVGCSNLVENARIRVYGSHGAIYDIDTEFPCSVVITCPYGVRSITIHADGGGGHAEIQIPTNP